MSDPACPSLRHAQMLSSFLYCPYRTSALHNTRLQITNQQQLTPSCMLRIQTNANRWHSDWNLQTKTRRIVQIITAINYNLTAIALVLTRKRTTISNRLVGLWSDRQWSQSKSRLIAVMIWTICWVWANLLGWDRQTGVHTCCVNVAAKSLQTCSNPESHLPMQPVSQQSVWDTVSEKGTDRQSVREH